MSSLTSIIQSALDRPAAGIAYALSYALHHHFHGMAVLQVEGNFDLLGYARAGHAVVLLNPSTHAMVLHSLDAETRTIQADPEIAVMDVAWQGHRLQWVRVTQGWMDYRFLVASSFAISEALLKAVSEWALGDGGDVLVFEQGAWRRSEGLLDELCKARWDDLVLPDDAKQRLLLDVEGFFESESAYARYGATWKRGILLLGPPGNGKTHAIKALASRIGKPVCYVRSLKAEDLSEHETLALIFRRARQLAPCLLVLEDVDSLVEGSNRTVFLNEMDGIASNHGLLTIGSANHPEKLDAAILERPSRFDRKVTFGLPEVAERARFLRRQTERWGEELALSLVEIEQVARATGGFSYAYLKELCLGTVLSYVRGPQPGNAIQIMLAELQHLRSEMGSASPSDEGAEAIDTEPLLQAPARRTKPTGMRRRRRSLASVR